MRSTQLPRAILARTHWVFALVLVLASATAAEARLFWQTYGSTTAAADCGCTWNWNQDYFVPRYPSSCKYDLYSPCKTSCSISPACRGPHQLYPGYCGIYRHCHYQRRNHVYGTYCGCTPLIPCQHAGCPSPCGVPLLPQHGGCGSGGLPGYLATERAAPEMMHLPNVEGTGLQILGSIPIEGNELFAGGDLSLLEDDLAGKKILIGPQMILPGKSLPSLGRQRPENLSQPLPSGP